jgi:hypothetical protein
MACTENAALRRFAWRLAAALVIATALLSFTALTDVVLRRVVGLPPDVFALARRGLQLGLTFPAIAALTSWLRGLLAASERTLVVSQGMALNLMVTSAGLVLGIVLALPGIPVAILALTAGGVAECAFLHWRAWCHRYAPARVALAPSPSLSLASTAAPAPDDP